MIHEFAVDPEAIANWPNFRYVTEKFGVSHGRLISRFPKRWEKQVLAACKNCRDKEKKKITEALIGVRSKFYNAGRGYDETLAWISNARSSHAADPFFAIITIADHSDSAGHLDVDSLSDENEAWATPRGAAVPRTAADLAAAAEKLLRCSAEIVLVDPHFGGEARFGKPLTAMIRCACDGRVPRRFEYHLSAKSAKSHLAAKALTSSEFKAVLEKHRPHLAIPAKVRIVFVRWDQLENGDTLHPRYVLTEKGGLRYDHGLDEGNPGETTDVECLDPTIHSHRWNQFSGGSAHFHLVDAWIVTSDAVTKASWNGITFIPEIR